MGYHYEERMVTSTRKMVQSITCDNCDGEIEFTQHDSSWVEPHRHLGLSLHGGYGAYFDSLGDEPYVILCKACADKLCAEWPVFAQAIKSAP